MVEGADDTTATPVGEVGLDHGGRDVIVAEQYLDGSNVVAVETCGTLLICQLTIMPNEQMNNVPSAMVDVGVGKNWREAH